MEFSESVLSDAQRTIDDSTAKVVQLVNDIPALVAKVVDHFYVPDSVKTAVVQCGQFVIDCLEKGLQHVRDAAVGLLAPFLMWNQHHTWNQVQATMSLTGSSLDPNTLSVGRLWSGEAADAYGTTLAAQSAAVGRVQDTAGAVAGALQQCAVAGMVFYAAVAGAVAMFTVEATAATAAVATGVGAPPGAAAAGVSVGKLVGLLVAAAAALGSLIAVQVAAMGAVEAQLNDATAMPGNHWPTAQGSTFSDATVTDGDADWSVRD